MTRRTTPRPPKTPPPPKAPPAPPLPKGWAFIDQATWGEIYGSSFETPSPYHGLAIDPDWNLRLIVAEEGVPARLSGYDPIYLDKIMASKQQKNYEKFVLSQLEIFDN